MGLSTMGAKWWTRFGRPCSGLSLVVRSSHEGSLCHFVMENHCMVAEQERVGHEKRTRRTGQDGSTSSDFTTEECSGMLRCRGGREKGRTGSSQWAQGSPRKEDVMISLLKMMRQPTEKKTQKGGRRPTKDTKRLGALGARDARGGKEPDA